jgi:hypothetical protein
MHKYKIGQTVYFDAPRNRMAASTEIYKIVRLIPLENDGVFYRIKSTAEAFERVARESDLSLRTAA